MNIGAMIQYYRTKKGLTQKELANGICSVSYLSKIENGSIVPKDDIIEMLFNRLDVNFTEITSYDTETIINAILQLYKRISESHLAAAKETLTILDRIITPFHSKECQNLFSLIRLYYFIEIKDIEEVEKLAPYVLELEGEFKGEGEHEYYFNKIVGLYYSFKAYPSTAIQYLNRAKSILQDLSLKDPEIYYLLALSSTRMQKPAHSIYYCQIALYHYKENLLYTRVTDCYNLLGLNYMQLEAYDISESYFLQILNSKPMGDNPDIQLRTYHNLSVVFYEKENLDKALEYIEKALQFEVTNYEQVNTYFLKASIHHLREEKELALENINIGYQLLSKAPSIKFQHKFYILEHQLNDTLNTPEFMRKAEKVLIPFFSSGGEKRTLKLLHKILADIYFEQGNFKKAAYHYKHIADTNKKLR